MSGSEENLHGFLERAPSAMRYENASLDPGNVAAKIAAMIDFDAKVLDVGCGTGSVSEVICTITGANLVGIEPNAERAAAARARGLRVYEGVLSESFLEAHGPFDAIVFADVLEHLADPAQTIALAKRGLAAGGAIVASVPNVAHWFVRWDLLRGRFDYQDSGIMDATHLRWFTRKTIVEFFERAGLRVTALDCTVNAELADYRRRAPWRWLERSRRRRVVGFLARHFPGLFGCQHVVRATLPE